MLKNSFLEADWKVGRQEGQEMSQIRILLAEDHQIVREGTRQLLEQASDLTVIGEAADGEEAVHMVTELHPDVVVMDVRLPKLNGIEATKTIKARHPDMPILILSAYENDYYVFPLLNAGANGYLLKTTSGADLAQAIRTVHAGETALDPRIAHKVVERLTNKEVYRGEEMTEGLTKREIEVLQVVAQGKSNREVGEELFISPHTVQVHLRNIFGKLGVGNRVEAVAYAVRQGWIALEEK
jgi:NarL family two-component system response regulator LiaR